MGRSCPVAFVGPVGFGSMCPSVIVTQNNRLEKICKQHFVDLEWIDPTSPQENDHKPTGSGVPRTAVGWYRAVAGRLSRHSRWPRRSDSGSPWPGACRPGRSDQRRMHRTGGHLAPVPGPSGSLGVAPGCSRCSGTWRPARRAGSAGHARHAGGRPAAVLPCNRPELLVYQIPR